MAKIDNTLPPITNNSGGGTSVHNDLSGLNVGNYIHLTALEKIKFNNLPNTFAPVDAEKNVNTDWNAVSGDEQLLNKPLTFPPSVHTHVEADITDLDKYTQLEVDNFLNSKVDKIAGKGLSTEDYTTTEKSKLAGIESGAEVNVNADWNAISGDAQILNKPTIPSISGLATEAYADAKVADIITNGVTTIAPSQNAVFDALDLKVDKVAGKSLIADTEIARLLSMTAIFTTALKTAYDSAVTWITTNGTNVLNHLSSTSNPHSVTKSQVGLSNVVNSDTTTTANITDSTNKRFVTDANLVVIGNTSGANTGDNAVNTTSNTYADAKVENNLTASTTVAPSKTAVNGGLVLKQNTSDKDSTGGYVGLTLFKINFKNALNTFTSFFTNSNTASRTYTFQDRNGIIADDTDLALKAPLANPNFTGSATITSSTVTPALKVTQTSTGDALLVEDSASDTTPFVINNVGTVIKGNATTLGLPTSHSVSLAAGIESIGAGTTSAMSVVAHTFTTASHGANFNGFRAVGTPGAFTTVGEDDLLVQFGAFGHDGVGFQRGGGLLAYVDGTPSAGSMPTRLILQTTPSGSVTPLDRASVNSLGNVAIGTTTHDNSAILQLDSTTRGFLPPRMTNAQMLAITTPAEGLIVYCTDGNKGLYQYKGSGWIYLDNKVDKTEWIDISATSTIVGFSVFTTKVIRYKLIDTNLILVKGVLSGTSNSTLLNFTIPFTSVNNVSNIGISGITNNSSSQLAPGFSTCNPNTSIVNIFRDFNAQAFTASGTKTGQFSILIEIQ